MTPTIHHGDCLDVLRAMPDNSVHAIITDPPYGLSNTTPEQVADTIVRWVNGEREYLPSARGFMDKEWDGFVPPVAVWDEAMRVLKPGGHVLAFAGTRTHDLMTLGLRLAGFDIRDSLAWLYGSGFPKSMDVSKAIDKASGAEREVIGPARGRLIGGAGGVSTNHGRGGVPYGLDAPTAPATEEAKKWNGWGTALKPATEPIVMARKPFPGTVAANVLEHGTGGLNIDACRIEATPGDYDHPGNNNHTPSRDIYEGGTGDNGRQRPPHPSGRWPANVILDEHMAGVLDEMSGVLKSGGSPASVGSGQGKAQNPSAYGHGGITRPAFYDSGGASRFFYVAEQDAPFMYAPKAPKKERPDVDGVKHPTVKPLSIMQWLVRLVTPPNGIVLDPFAGSGTTIEAAILEGFQVIGIEREAEYLPLIRHRIDRATEQLKTEQQQQAEAPDQGAFPLEDIA